MFSSRNVHAKLNKYFPVNVFSNLLSPAEAVRNLSVWFDSDFSFSCHVRNTCKACFAQEGILSDSQGISCVMVLFWLQIIWLEADLTRVIPCLEVSLLLTFTNSSVQKSLARIVANTKYSHIAPV